MSFKEIKELRKSGNLEEALTMAQEDLHTDPKNIWTQRAISWVHYDYLKKHVESKDYPAFASTLQTIKELEVGQDEKIFFDNCAWKIGSMVFALARENNIDYNKIIQVFELIKTFHFTKPSDAYSFLFKAFHKGLKKILNPNKYIEFVDWWDYNNFQPKDYLEEEYKGRTTITIVEQAYSAYAKKLLEQNPVDKQKIEKFMPEMDDLIEKHPDYQYPSYYKAKMLIALGDEEDVLSSFLPFAKQKRNDFWVWGIMAEIFKNDKKKQMACYCKALSLKTPEDFLVKLRQTFAEILIAQKFYDEAKTELKIAVQTRRKNEWKIPNKIKIWGSQDWFKNAMVKENNNDFYQKHLSIAEEILYQDVLEETIAVEFVNRDKKILNFVKDKEKSGFFNYSKNIEAPQIGDVFAVRLKAVGGDGFYSLLTSEKLQSTKGVEAIKKFKGAITIVNSQNFGFVNNEVFVDSNMVQNKNLDHFDIVSGKAILSYNKKKKEWGWKAFEIQA